MILIIDNYDSFVYNLARYLEELGYTQCVKRNDVITIAEIQALSPSHIILSPGPCSPSEAGICVELIQQLGHNAPILGVCLGHQSIAAAYGGRIVRSQHPMHGKGSMITHAGTDLFQGLPQPLRVGRYHSLIAEEDSLPDCLKITARSETGEIMAFSHQKHQVHGVQFHPESILTENGKQLLSNFLEMP